MAIGFSVQVPFAGDYIGLRRNQDFWRALKRNRLHKMDRRMVFSDIVNKVHRSNGKVRPRVIESDISTNIDDLRLFLYLILTLNIFQQHQPPFPGRLRAFETESSVEEDLH